MAGGRLSVCADLHGGVAAGQDGGGRLSVCA
jgi:hypothetical protein